MDGLNLCERFFQEVGLPLLAGSLHDKLDFIAAGLPGGSQCHNNDDRFSRDHGWGPGFIVWIEDSDRRDILEPVEKALEGLPSEFEGHRVLRYGACDFDEYVHTVVGISGAPLDPYEWLRIPEQALFEIVHRPVFLDGSGFAGRRFREFGSYPEDVWRQRLAAALFWLQEWGGKHLGRAEQRGDKAATLWYWARFSEYAAKALCLIERRYAPYSKWLFRTARELSPWTSSVIDLIEMELRHGELQVGAADICARIVEGLDRIGIAPTNAVDHGRPVAYQDSLGIGRYRRAVRSSIKDRRIAVLHDGLELVFPPTKMTETWVCPEITGNDKEG